MSKRDVRIEGGGWTNAKSARRMVEERGTARWTNAEHTRIAMIEDDHRVYSERHSAAAPALPVREDEPFPHREYIADPRPWSGFAGFLAPRIYGYPSIFT